MSKDNKLHIRNSTAEFLIFTKNSTGETIDVRLQHDTVWLTQKLISALFDVDRSVITKNKQVKYGHSNLLGNHRSIQQ